MSVGGSVKELKTKEELDHVRQSGAPVILHFWASWCEASKHMDQVFSHLSTDFPHAHFFRVSFFVFFSFFCWVFSFCFFGWFCVLILSDRNRFLG